MFPVSRSLALAAIVAAGFLAPGAHASVIVTFSQSGSDVTVTATGSADLTDLSAGSSASNFGTMVWGQYSRFAVGPSSGPAWIYTGLTETSGGTMYNTSASQVTGSGSGTGLALFEFPFNSTSGELILPQSYSSGSISSSGTFSNTTLSNLGLVTGTYVWSWGSSHPDSITVDIGQASAAPEPSSLALAGLGAAALFLRRRKRLPAARGE